MDTYPNLYMETLNIGSLRCDNFSQNNNNQNKHMIRELTIKPVLNGYVVQAGCQQLVFNTPEALCDNLLKYYNNPEIEEKAWIEHGFNAKHTLGVAVSPPLHRPYEGDRNQSGGSLGAVQPGSVYPNVQAVYNTLAEQVQQRAQQEATSAYPTPTRSRG